MEFLKKLLKLEINDSYRTIKFNYNQVYNIIKQLIHNISDVVCNSFFNRQSGPLFSFYRKTHMMFDRKFESIIRNESNKQKIKPIRYTRCPNTMNTFDVENGCTNKNNTNQVRDNIVVDIKPSMFINADYNTSRLNDKWFINLSSTTIPENITSLLQLGDNFSLPVTSVTELATKFVINYENNLRKLPTAKRVDIRNRSTGIVNSLRTYRYPHFNTYRNLLRLNDLTKSFLKMNQNLIITRADKGNITVALDRDMYIQKVEELLCDEETYVLINRNPINKLISNLKDLLKRWKNNGYITQSTHRSLLYSEGSLPRAYGLPKVHKPKGGSR